MTNDTNDDVLVKIACSGGPQLRLGMLSLGERRSRDGGFAERGLDVGLSVEVRRRVPARLQLLELVVVIRRGGQRRRGWVKIPIGIVEMLEDVVDVFGNVGSVAPEYLQRREGGSHGESDAACPPKSEGMWAGGAGEKCLDSISASAVLFTADA